MPEIVQQLKPVVLAELNPPLNITVVKDAAGLEDPDWKPRKAIRN
jgi:hypothetical protein